MMHETLQDICKAKKITLTPLRNDVMTILLSQHKPMGAYDILKELKKKRSNAEPPTVYRVLEFLMQSNLIHRIASQNAFICCSSLTTDKKPHNTLLLSCDKCEKGFEFEDDSISDILKKFAKKNLLEIDVALIEVKGLCPECLLKKINSKSEVSL